jgi:hypothetical protein
MFLPRHPPSVGDIIWVIGRLGLRTIEDAKGVHSEDGIGKLLVPFFQLFPSERSSAVMLAEEMEALML